VPSEVAPDLPPELDAWWLRAVSRSIEGRFQSARELACAFGDALGIREAGASTSQPPIEPMLLDDARSVRPDGSSPGRWRRLGYLVAVTGLMAALVLPLVEHAFGHGARSNVTTSAAHHAEEVTGQAPNTTLTRIEVEAIPLAPVVSAQRAARFPRPAWRSSPAPVPRAPRPSHARPPLKDDPDGVLGI